MSWRMQFFAPPKASGPAYVRDGLVLWLDGIDNAGVGVHDPNATEWVNLVDGTPFELRGDYTVEADAMHFNPTAATGIATGDISLPRGDRTVEAMLTDISLISGSRTSWITAMEDIPALWVSGVDYQSGVYTGAYDYNMGGDGNSLLRSETFTEEGWRHYVDAADKGVATGTVYTLPAVDGQMSVGNRLDLARSLNAHIHSVRIYSRALSPDEIRQNYEVDKERFHL